jgi:aminoglycoside phosphotransferase (APT) family kinase protein
MSHGPPPAEVEITADTVYGLLFSQHPDLAELPLGPRYEGFDNVIWRLGDSLAVRLPRIVAAVGSMRKEIAWLPRLRELWSFPAPVPERAGEPGEGYPWPWSVVTWVPGSIWADEPWDGRAARPFARALREVHIPAPHEPPRNPAEEAPLRERGATVREAIAGLEGRIGPDGSSLDVPGAQALWNAAVAAASAAGLVLAHADLHLYNVVSLHGEFAGITDWGDLCAADPAVDVGQAWLLLPHDSVGSFLAEYGADDGLIARGRGFALERALRFTGSDDEAVASCGWRALTSLGVASR